MRSYTVMDHNKTPASAYIQIGTVLVRMKMEDPSCSSHYEKCPATRFPDSLHRPSGCEHCTRTRMISQYSDCDSGVQDKSRPYRSSSARSKHINFCAAVCLLLLAARLSPLSTASPHRSRGTMDRQKRDVSSENRLWGNPCDYDDNSKPTQAANPKDAANKIVVLATNAKTSTEAYKDTFAKLHSYNSFDLLLKEWTDFDWLRKFNLPDEVLPREKQINVPMPDEYINNMMMKVDDILPSMYKALKLIVAGLYSFSKEGLNSNIVSDVTLKNNINQTMMDVRTVMCYFSEFMKARNLVIAPLPDSEVPDFKNDDKLNNGLLLYRDTINYLEYLVQVFQELCD